MAFMLGLFKPVIEINGQRVGNTWSRQIIPLAPGQYLLHVHVPYLWPLGPADLPVNIYPGQTLELEYRAPMIAFIRGALGAPPQKWPGLVATIILFAIVGILFLCICGGIIVGIVADSGNSSGTYTLPALTQLAALLR
ncbi:hypothetical protein Adu01nite_34770 [Paractinoplanes durhamensis]|uniref:Uncharacterized protein n=1 Tax=Paractinoplanes durhamensis TaxID=113563 RepID=A0ABQ3YX06_9ACTN|nr:hypothetical protein Adu01nite_34770 [Actinoplanes durhamensis]